MERWTRPRKAAPFQPRHWRAHPRFVPLIFRLPCGRTTEMAGNAGMIESLMSGILGDTRRPDADRPAPGVPLLGAWLPSSRLAAQTGILLNTPPRGFVLGG